MLSFTITDNSINIVLDGSITTIGSDATNFNELKAELHKGPGLIDEARVSALADVKSFIEVQTFGRVKIGDDGRAYFDNTRVGGTLGTRIRDMVRGGHDVSILAKFMDKLGRNPIESAKRDVYSWIESCGLTLTSEGNFLAFKRVNDDYTSRHDGTTQNNLGTIVEVPIDDCDTNPENLCSSGLHFCGFSYLKGFGGTRTIIVEVDPIDVVAIPTDYNYQKGRAWRYKVIDEIDNDIEDDWLEDKVVHDAEGTFPTDDAFGPCDPDLETYYDEDEATDQLDEQEEVGDDVKEDYQLFHHGTRVFTADFILHQVSAGGQRAFSRANNIPRSTLQNWLKKIAEHTTTS